VKSETVEPPGLRIRDVFYPRSPSDPWIRKLGTATYFFLQRAFCCISDCKDGKLRVNVNKIANICYQKYDRRFPRKKRDKLKLHTVPVHANTVNLGIFSLIAF
jgi:hypothetical protein